jgi:hypothetical protein
MLGRRVAGRHSTVCLLLAVDSEAPSTWHRTAETEVLVVVVAVLMARGQVAQEFPVRETPVATLLSWVLPETVEAVVAQEQQAATAFPVSVATVASASNRRSTELRLIMRAEEEVARGLLSRHRKPQERVVLAAAETPGQRLTLAARTERTVLVAVAAEGQTLLPVAGTAATASSFCATDCEDTHVRSEG